MFNHLNYYCYSGKKNYILQTGGGVEDGTFGGIERVVGATGAALESVGFRYRAIGQQISKINQALEGSGEESSAARAAPGSRDRSPRSGSPYLAGYRAADGKARVRAARMGGIAGSNKGSGTKRGYQGQGSKDRSRTRSGSPTATF